MRSTLSERYFTPPQAGKWIGVNADKVLAWINAGELPASNVATSGTGERPRWRIAEDDLAKFLFRRRNLSAEPTRPKKRKRESAKADAIFPRDDSGIGAEKP